MRQTGAAAPNAHDIQAVLDAANGAAATVREKTVNHAPDVPASSSLGTEAQNAQGIQPVLKAANAVAAAEGQKHGTPH
eukprot:NODE_20936_length_776_cov_1.548536.p5 GENE.NODE_20936_length_776_cov_1.548536~~NODE_20936_length_776_cov_1.548536.p5  ORF type:complete len:78 (-),score=12.17 NODE_20936_length_776_cov_1.548536:139-372(-)